MNVPTTLTSLSAAALLWAAPSSPQQQGLTPVDEPMKALSQAQEPLPTFRALEAARALRADSIAERTQAFEAVLEAARQDDAALEQVRAWAADEAGDRELAWTATLLLRELASQPHSRTKARRTSPFRINGDPFDTSWIDEVFEDLHGDFRGGFGADPFDSLRRRGASPFDPDLFGRVSPGPGGTHSGSSTRISITPGGVKLEVEETVDGKTETKTYEAESLDALYEAHPELKDGAGAGLRFELGGRSLLGFDELDDLFDRRWQGRGPGLRPLQPSLEVLGVRMLEPEARETVYEGVSSEVGLEVVEVVPGSLADALGVQPGELVLTIAGEEIASAADVRRVLGALSLERRIDVECVTTDGKVRVRSWKPKGDGATGLGAKGDVY